MLKIIWLPRNDAIVFKIGQMEKLDNLLKMKSIEGNPFSNSKVDELLKNIFLN